MEVLKRLYGDTQHPTLGRNVETGTRVRLYDPERSTYIIGAQGTGKSTLIFNLALHDIELADKGLIVLDAHGDLTRQLLLKCPPKHAHRVVYFAPAEQKERVLGFNPFELKSQQELELKVGALMDVFAHAWYGGFENAPTLQATLGTLIRTLLYAYPTFKSNFLHMMLLTLIDPEGKGKKWRSKFSPIVKHNPALAQSWKEWQTDSRLKTDVESTRMKVRHVILADVLYPILCQPTSAECFQFQDVLANKGILLVNLAGLDDIGQKLVGSLILGQLHVMAQLRKKETDRIPCHIYADEFYKFSPQSIAKIIVEFRKFKLFCTLAHQNLAQLGKEAAAATAICDNVIAFRVNPADSATMRKHFGADGELPSTTFLANLPLYQAMVRYARGKTREQALIKTLPEKRTADREVAKSIWERSKAYGRPRQEIQQYIDDILESEDERQRTPERASIREKRKTSGN